MLHAKFHLTLLVETWLEENIHNDIELPLYTSHTVMRFSHSGGLILYVNSLFQSVKINNLCCIRVNNCFESLFVHIELGWV